MPNFIIHQIGAASVATNLGRLYPSSNGTRGAKRFCIHCSLPYLDPTDHFFHDVAVAMLNEVHVEVLNENKRTTDAAKILKKKTSFLELIFVK